jgi:hypothetical protein
MARFRSILSRIDGFLAAILLTVAFASLVPARGDLLGPRSGCWPHAGEVAGGAVADPL